MAGDVSRANGRKGGRPRGSAHAAKAAIVREQMAAAGTAVALAQIELALGCQQVFKRTSEGGYARVTNDEEILRYLAGGAKDPDYLLVAAKDADNRACDSVLNRAFGKPKEVVEVEVNDRRKQYQEMSPDALRARATQIAAKLARIH